MALVTLRILPATHVFMTPFLLLSLAGCASSAGKQGANQDVPTRQQQAERERLNRQGDELLARGQALYNEGVAQHDEGKIKDGRLMMIQGQRQKNQAEMMTQSPRKSPPQEQ